MVWELHILRNQIAVKTIPPWFVTESNKALLHFCCWFLVYKKTTEMDWFEKSENSVFSLH